MQNTLFNIAEELDGAELIDAHLTFRPFIRFLKERLLQEKTMKVNFLEYVINVFEQRLQGKECLLPEEMAQYEDLLELMYAALFPAAEDEARNLWALSLPMKPNIFYGTDAFYELLRNKETGKIRSRMIDAEHKVRKKLNTDFVYAVVLQKCYHYTLSSSSEKNFVNSFEDPVTGLSKFYRMNVDSRFMDIFPKQALPALDLAVIKSHARFSDTRDYLLEHLPLTLFRFEGLSVMTITDITADYVIENIKNIVLDRSACGRNSYQDDLIRSLKALVGNASVDFGLIPAYRINGRPAFSDDVCMYSILGSTAKENGEEEEAYMSMAEAYFRDPQLLFFETITRQEEKQYFFLKVLKQAGVKAYGLLPVYYNNKVAGMLEVYSKEEGMLDHEIVRKLDVAFPLLAQLLQRSIDEFEERIKLIIKENFTSLQPSVEWKFNEVAWHFLRDHHWKEDHAGIETIYFKEVYPLYGAIDIRNSTLERNLALRRDLQTQFDILEKTLAQLGKRVNLGLVDELIYKCRKWLNTPPDELTTAGEMDLNDFLKNDIELFLRHFKASRPETSAIIDPYFEAIDEAKGAAFQHRRELEKSIQMINKSINRHLEAANNELQQSYPAYFEKFRTDGVEYDIYIGQAFAPDSPFDLLYLKNLRLWQLKSMAIIANLTHSLLPQIPGRLQTTQLIFVHSGAIDISFRKDERRFDVEGGYNIRYQVVKKRIDKVHIKDSNERLTQPGMIAIVYFNEKEAEEYIGYIRYLQEKNILTTGIEHLELEELQGVNGLKAIRVGVRLDQEETAGYGQKAATAAKKDAGSGQPGVQEIRGLKDAANALEEIREEEAARAAGH